MSDIETKPSTNSQAKRLWRSIVGTSAARIIQMAASLTGLIVTARLLGADGRGLFVASITWANTFVMLGGMSLDRVALHRGANEEGNDWVQEVVADLAAFIPTAAVLSVGIGAGLHVGTNGELFGELPVEYLLMAALLVPLALWDTQAGALLVATGGLSVLNRIRVLGAFAQLLGIAVFVWLADMGVAGAIVAAMAARVCAGLLIFRQVRRVAQARWLPSRRRILNMLYKGSQLHINTVGIYIRSQVDILMLMSFLTPAAVGIYQMGSRFIELMLVVPEAAVVSLWQEMGRTSPDAVWNAQKRLLFKLLALLLLMSTVGYLLAPIVVPWLLGEEFRESAFVFQVLLPIVIGRSVGTVFGSQIVARGWFWQASALGLTVAGLNVVLNYLWIPLHGVPGAIGASLISYGVVPIVLNIGWGLIIERKVKAARANEAQGPDAA